MSGVIISVRLIQRGRERERESERKRVCVCVREGERKRHVESVCVCVCVRERERAFDKDTMRSCIKCKLSGEGSYESIVLRCGLTSRGYFCV